MLISMHEFQRQRVEDSLVEVMSLLTQLRQRVTPLRDENIVPAEFVADYESLTRCIDEAVDCSRKFLRSVRGEDDPLNRNADRASR
jgi:hypothetical protein